jgi:hypothetical protein
MPVHQADQAHAIDVGQNGRRAGDAAGPDQAADGCRDIQLPMGADQRAAQRSRARAPGRWCRECSCGAAGRTAGPAPACRDGDQPDQADAHGARHRIEAVVHQHRHAVCAQQVHAETAGEQAKHDLPERRGRMAAPKAGFQARPGAPPLRARPVARAAGRCQLGARSRMTNSAAGTVTSGKRRRSRAGSLPAHAADGECEQPASSPPCPPSSPWTGRTAPCRAAA